MLKQNSSFYACYTTKLYVGLPDSSGLWIPTIIFQPKYMNVLYLFYYLN